MSLQRPRESMVERQACILLLLQKVLIAEEYCLLQKNESVQGNRTVVSRSPSQLLKLVY